MGLINSGIRIPQNFYCQRTPVGGGGVLPNMGYIGMCGLKGLKGRVFQPFCS